MRVGRSRGGAAVLSARKLLSATVQSGRRPDLRPVSGTAAGHTGGDHSAQGGVCEAGQGVAGFEARRTTRMGG